MSYLPFSHLFTLLTVEKYMLICTANSQKKRSCGLKCTNVLEFGYFGIMFTGSVECKIVHTTIRFTDYICNGHLFLGIHWTRLHRWSSIFNEQLCDVIQIAALCFRDYTNYENNCQRTKYGIHPKCSGRCNYLFAIERVREIEKKQKKDETNNRITHLISSDLQINENLKIQTASK